jgi:uncharacterized protein (TIGR00369 family)
MSEDAPREPGWSETMGVNVVRASPDEVIAEIEIAPRHLQALGFVHGGVHAGLIETAASLGASLVARARGEPPPMGIENHTSFIRAAREGRVRVTAKPLTRGRTSQLWEASVEDANGQLLATGRVRLVPPRANRA